MEQPGCCGCHSEEPISSQAFYVFENPRAFMGMVTWAALNMDRDNTGALHLSMALRRAFIEEARITESICCRLCCCTLQILFLPPSPKTVKHKFQLIVAHISPISVSFPNETHESLKILTASVVSGNCEEQTLKSI